MISAATGMFLTEATDTPIGLAVMLLWWFLDLNGNIFQMGGGYAGFSLCPRHNSILGAQVFADHFWALAANRILLAALSLILLGASALILEAKRKGCLLYTSFEQGIVPLSGHLPPAQNTVHLIEHFHQQFPYPQLLGCKGVFPRRLQLCTIGWKILLHLERLQQGENRLGNFFPGSISYPRGKAGKGLNQPETQLVQPVQRLSLIHI